MDNIGGIFLVIVGIIFAMISKANKAAKEQRAQQNGNPTAKTTVQSQIRQAMQQINELKDTSMDEFTSSHKPSAPPQPPPHGKPVYKSSLEGFQMEGAKVEGYQMEGTQVEGYQMEGTQVEGLANKHSDSKFQKKGAAAYTESSMQRGYAGEGCAVHYDASIKLSSTPSMRKAKRTINFSENPVIQGIIMSQVLERPKRR